MKKAVQYIVPAALLYKAAQLLLPPERLCFVTGIKRGHNTIVLTDLIEVQGEASRVHVRPDPASVLRIHQQLLAMGQDVEALFHSHPGWGIEATQPSFQDLRTVEGWEEGAPFIGAIISEDGRFVRFFNGGQASEVKIYGTHLPTDSPHCFELPALPGSGLSAQAS
jgi:hypothetical protein